jgi:hypothetical protein
MGLGFLAISAFISNATNLRETIVYLLALFSQSVALSIDRGNFDMLMFIILALTCHIFKPTAARRSVSYLAIFLGALLKFYPVVAFSLALTEKVAIFCAVAITAGIAGTTFVWYNWRDFIKLWHHIPHAQPLQDAFGGLNFFQASAHLAMRRFPEHAHALILIGNLLYATATIAAVWMSLKLARRYLGRGLAVPQKGRVAALYLSGASITLFAFFSTQNPPYRAIWLLFLLPMFLELRRNEAFLSERAKITGCIFLLVLVLWFEFFHIWIGRLTSSPAIEDLTAYLIREPLWWVFITGIMTVTWMQLASTPLFSRFNIFYLQSRLNSNYSSFSPGRDSR